MAVVGGTKVTSCKQAAKLMKQSPEKFTVRIERLTNVKSQEQEIKFEEDSISVKVFFHLLSIISQEAVIANYSILNICLMFRSSVSNLPVVIVK